MDVRVNRALKNGLIIFGEHLEPAVSGQQYYEGLKAIFDSEADFMAKLDRLDEFFDEQSPAEELREPIYDLLLINFFSDDIKRLDDDYLESAEWLEIEEQTIDRGTELLNLLLYLKECADEELEPDLEDFLKEFLLVDEDEFQDEYRIYEPMISNAMLTESTYAEISAKTSDLDENEEELAAFFYPFMAYFNEIDPNVTQLKEFMGHSPNRPFDGFIYTSLISYFKSAPLYGRK